MPDFAVRTVFTGMDKLSPVMKRMGNQTSMIESKFKSLGKTMLGFAGVAGGITALVGGFKKIVSAAQMMEDAEAAFTPLMGGAEKANELVKALNKTSASTPYQFDDIAKASKQLLPVMNQDIERTIKTFRMLGDTAGGNAQKLDSITRGFTKSMLKGKVDMESLNMIAEAGVPIFTELADTMGYGRDNMSKMFKDISAGKFGTDDLIKTFERMTSSGGIFFEGMIIASKTTSGVFSNLSDDVTLTAAAIGQQLLPYIKNAALEMIKIMQAIGGWVEENKALIGLVMAGLIKSLKVIGYLLPWIIGFFVAYKAAIIGVKAIQKIMMAVGWIKYLWMMRATIFKATMATKLFSVAQAALNAVMAIGLLPILAIIAAVALLAGAAYLIYKNWEPIKEFFSGLWSGIVSGFNSAIDWIIQKFTAVVDWVANKWKSVKSFFGFASDSAGEADAELNRGRQAPNSAEVRGRAASTVVNVNNATPGTSATVNPRRGAVVNMNRVGANP